MDWNDGRGAEVAQERLEALSQQDWSALPSLSAERGPKWRGCLATLLHPGQGPAAQRLLLELTGDPDEEVAFLAAASVAFYCGVNSSADRGHFMDLRIQVPSFVALARATPELPARIRRLMTSGSSHWEKTFQLLLGVLASEA